MSHLKTIFVSSLLGLFIVHKLVQICRRKVRKKIIVVHFFGVHESNKQTNIGGYSDKVEEVDIQVNNLDGVTCLDIEGLGKGIPFEMVEKFDPYHPTLIGGISFEEEKVGYMQARLKQHSRHTKPLNTRDSISVSIGWKCYLTTYVYAMEEIRQTGSHQMLHYTPKHTLYLAMFWDPLASPNTELVAVQNVTDDKDAFQITTGVLLDCNRADKIVKECKWKGTPYKIIGNTSLTKDMFTSNLEHKLCLSPKALKFGTTMLSINCGQESGIYMAVDGLGHSLRDDQEAVKDGPEKGRYKIVGRNEQKAFYLGGSYMIATVAGSNVWFEPIIEHLTGKMRWNKKLPRKRWKTPEQCARYSHTFLNQENYQPDPKKYKLTDAELKKAMQMKCEITFAAYIPHPHTNVRQGELVPSVFSVKETMVLEITQHGQSTRKKACWNAASFITCGSGEKSAEKVLKRHAQEIASDELVSEELKIICLKALQDAGFRDEYTGGIFTVYHIHWDTIRKYSIDQNLVGDVIKNFYKKKREAKRKRIEREEMHDKLQARARRERKRRRKTLK